MSEKYTIDDQTPLGSGPYDQFDQHLLQTLTCVKALNFKHIAFIGRALDNIPDSLAYKVLWHLEQSKSDKTFKRLQKLCSKGLISPWRSWSPDNILINPPGRAAAKRTGVFYVLGREGRRWLRAKSTAPLIPGVVEELYSTIPLAKWLTASSCALTLQANGMELICPAKVWVDRKDVPSPNFHPDCIVRGDNLTAYYIVESPFILRSEFFVSHVARGLHCLESNSRAIILTRTKEAFQRIALAMQGRCAGENKGRIFLGDLMTFQKQSGQCSFVSAVEK